MIKVKTFQLSGLDDEKIDLIKRTVCKGATNEELQLFLHVCNKTGLDPFVKQIHSIKRGESRTIQTSIDGFRLIADRTKNYAPGREATYVYNDKGGLVSATSYIKKRTEDGTWHEVSATAHWSEYRPPKYNEKMDFWDRMPHLMLAKCAEALALRKAFPSEMSGLYTDDEMGQAGKSEMKVEEISSEPVVEPKLSDEQFSEVVSLIGENQELGERILKRYDAANFHDIKEKDYGVIVHTLKTRYNSSLAAK